MAVAVKEAVKKAVPEWLQAEILKLSTSIKKDWKRGLSMAKREFELVKDVALVDYNTLRESVGKLNVILRSCEYNNDNNIVKVMFGLRINNCKSLLWKATTRVMCLKVNLQQKTVKVVRVLTIAEFWRLRSDILEEVRFKNLLESNIMADFQLIDHRGEVIQDGSDDTNTELPVLVSLTTSGIFKRVEKLPADESECLICMDNKVGITLPCAHSFCSECIKTWYNTNQSCPVCRDYLEKTEDCWEFTDLPDLEEINEKVVELATGDKTP